MISDLSTQSDACTGGSGFSRHAAAVLLNWERVLLYSWLFLPTVPRVRCHFLLPTVLHPDPSKPRQQDALEGFVQTAAAPAWGCSQTTTPMGAGVKQPGVSGVHSSASVPQEHFSLFSLYSMEIGCFSPLQLSKAVRPLETGGGEVFGGKVSRENLMQCTRCL